MSSSSKKLWLITAEELSVDESDDGGDTKVNYIAHNDQGNLFKSGQLFFYHFNWITRESTSGFFEYRKNCRMSMNPELELSRSFRFNLLVSNQKSIYNHVGSYIFRVFESLDNIINICWISKTEFACALAFGMTWMWSVFDIIQWKSLYFETRWFRQINSVEAKLDKQICVLKKYMSHNQKIYFFRDWGTMMMKFSYGRWTSEWLRQLCDILRIVKIIRVHWNFLLIVVYFFNFN